jgi:hypothetical protein
MWLIAASGVVTSCSAACINPKQQHELPILLLWLLGLCIPDQPNHSFRPYAVFIEDMNSHTEGRCSGLLGKEAMKYDSYH